MSDLNSIEIADSDEESLKDPDEAMEPQRHVTPPPTAGAKAKMANESTPKTTKTGMEKVSSGITKTTVLSGESSSPPTSDKTGTSPETSMDASSRAGRNRARKSQHQTLRMSPTDCQFESIAVEEDGPSAPKQPKLEMDAVQTEESVKKTISDFIHSEEIQELIKSIAKERVRCNFLLATYQLPDMNFTLNTPMETLRFQLQERLKQRRDRGKASPSTAAPSTSAGNKANTKGVVRAKQPQAPANSAP